MSFPLVLSIAGFIFCIGAFVYFRSYIDKRTGRDAVLAEIREEINRLLIRMDETTNRDITLIEDKEQSLKTLLEETERRLKVYTREIDRSLAGEKVYRELGKSKATGNLSFPPVENTNPLKEAPSAGQNLPEKKSVREEPLGSKPIGEQIKDLAALGFSSTVIASKLGVSISEVELVLAMLVERKPQV